MQKSALKLAGNRNYFKPFAYPWAYDAFVQSEQMHWLWTEVPMMEDVKDFQLKLTDSERDFLTKILRFFTQGDIDVSGAYVTTYLPQFPQPEIRMMLSSFAGREAVHIAAYSHLIETLGLPEDEDIDSNTVNGLVQEKTCHLPKVGDHFTLGGYEGVVTRTARRRVTEVRFTHTAPAPQDDEKDKDKRFSRLAQRTEGR